MPEPNLDRHEEGFDENLNLILNALDHIKKHMPNGEIKVIQSEIQKLNKNYEEQKDDMRKIKKYLLDPEEGLVVKLNKYIDVVEKQEEYRENVLSKKVDAVTQLENWKDGVNKVLWILFATLAGIILNLILAPAS
jgi:soluble cytochrome b562